MNLREAALVAFTLLMQASVGILLVLAALPLVQGPGAKAAGWSPGSRLNMAIGIAGGAALLGLLASLLHLGQPVLAWLAVANVRDSWLSREIAMAMAFVIALAVYWLAHAAGAAASLRALATAAAVIAGLAVVVAMSRLYMIAGQPAWDRLATPAGFFASSALLGLSVIVTVATPAIGVRAVRLLALAAIVLLAFQVLLVPVLLSAIAGEPAAAISPASVGHLAVWLAAGRILLAAAAAVLLAGLLRGAPALHVIDARLAALGLVVLSEVAGRLLFYASAVRL